MDGSSDLIAKLWRDVTSTKNYWDGINLNGIRTRLDAQGLSIADNQEKSLKNRKKLADQTRNFRKLPDEEKPKEIGQLLKAYQEEIDELTKRSKFAESAFLDLYKSLCEAPDPSAVLSAILQQRANIEKGTEAAEEYKELEEKVREYEKEFKELKNQEVTIRQLEEANKMLTAQLDTAVQKALELKQQEWNEERHKMAAAFRKREDELNEQLKQAQDEADTLLRQYEKAQSDIFNLRMRLEESQAGEESQNELVSEEVERLSAQIATLQGEKEALQQKLRDIKSTRSDAAQEWELEIAQKDAQISQLLHSMHHMEAELNQAKNKNAEAMAQLQDKLKATEQRARLLETELQARPSLREFEEVKKKLEMLEEIELGGTLSDDGLQAAGGVRSVEQILAQKNKNLEGEITKLKLDLSSTQEELKATRERELDLSRALAEREALVAKLEDDLLMTGSSLTIGAGNMSSSASVISTGGRIPLKHMTSLQELITPSSAKASSQYPQDPFASTTRINNSNNDLDALETQSVISVTSSIAAAAAPTTESDAAMLKIVSGQRDRFKSQLMQVQEENQQLHQRIDTLQNEIEQKKQDNVKLYEKIRYLQNYNRESASSGSKKRLGTGSRISTSIDVVDLEDPSESQYRKLYEDSINPFAMFHRKERDQQYKELSAPEKIIFSFSRFFLSNKHARMFLFFYALCLHLLVCLAMYWLAHRSVDCPAGSASDGSAVAAAATLNAMKQQ